MGIAFDNITVVSFLFWLTTRLGLTNVLKAELVGAVTVPESRSTTASLEVDRLPALWLLSVWLGSWEFRADCFGTWINWSGCGYFNKMGSGACTMLGAVKLLAGIGVCNLASSSGSWS